MNSILNWVVIGAGPAGIAAIGKLLDSKIPPAQIGWIDPAFRVGDLGEKWYNVPGNTAVELFRRYLKGCPSFEYGKEPFPIDKLDGKETCLLKEIAAPLQWVTDHLKKKVKSVRGEALALNLLEGRWEIKTKSSPIFAKNVILATGAEPKNLSHAGPAPIPLEVALNPEKLAHHIHPKDVVAVFGSSHSAVLVLANLQKLPAKAVYNFYLVPHFYAVPLDDWILFDDGGLKGFAAQWAKKHLDGKLPENFKRVTSSDRTFEEAFSLCNKIIYAVGFEKRKLPVLEQFETAAYNQTTGIIAPGLFGLGIAFPQAKFDRLGNLEYRVGLWKFMDYLNTVFPIWLKYGNI